MRLEKNIKRVAEQIVEGMDGEKYIHDPEHKMRSSDLPAGKKWHKTDRGWSSFERNKKQETSQGSGFEETKKAYEASIYRSVGADGNSYVKENMGESIRQMELAFNIPEVAYPDVKKNRPPMPKSEKLRKRREDIERLVGMWSSENIDKVLPAGEEGKFDLLLFDQIRKDPTMGFDLDVSKGLKIKTSKDVAALLWKFRDPLQEKMTVISLGAGGKVLSARLTVVGLLDSMSVSPQVLLSRLPKGTKSIIISHNHPSGNSTPSTEDVRSTRRLKEVCDNIGVTLSDHVVTNGTYSSFREMGLVNFTPAKFSNATWDSIKEPSEEGRYNPQDPNYHLAEWEAVPFHMRPKVVGPDQAEDVLRPLNESSREGKFIHILKTDTQSRLVGVERISADSNGGPERIQKIVKRIHQSILSNGGCAAYIVGYSYNDPNAHDINSRITASSRVIGILPQDFIDKDYRSARNLRIFDPPKQNLTIGGEGSFSKPNTGVWGN